MADTGKTIALIKALGGSGGGSGGGGPLIVTDTNGTLDKTWQEIHDADFAVIKIEKSLFGMRLSVIKALKDRDETSFTVLAGNGVAESAYFKTYTASSASGYPTLSE